MRLLKTSSTLALNTSKDGAFTASLGSLFNVSARLIWVTKRKYYKNLPEVFTLFIYPTSWVLWALDTFWQNFSERHLLDFKISLKVKEVISESFKTVEDTVSVIYTDGNNITLFARSNKKSFISYLLSIINLLKYKYLSSWWWLSLAKKLAIFSAVKTHHCIFQRVLYVPVIDSWDHSTDCQLH